ncbi:hypothetical protein [Candidatus Skiveiella danica]|uniref:hypothetical protein n=1 Tax=Candidatus Skiveiella danica TaxID=3386177 RepID=UPI001DC241A6|nr:hypothetical protein [Betaproteobacteria bacterium]
MLLYFPDMFGHMYTYQVVAGLLIVIILAQYTLPAILSPEHLTGKRIIFCNLLISALPFLAITYAPVSLLLFVVSARKDHIAKSILMLIAGGIANIIILKLIGSIRGFLAFHIYLNTITMRDYGGGQTVRQLIEGVFTNSAMDLNHFIIMLLLLASTAQMAMSEKRFPWRSVLLMLGISSLLMRGFGFHGLPYYYSMLAIPLALLSNRASESITLKAFGFVVVTICIIKLSLIIPGSGSKFEARKVPNETEFSLIAQLYTEKDDRIIAYSFNNIEYIAANRLPASGHFFYLPWQEAYNKNPKFGIKIDACKEISEYRPKIMLITKWNVWDRYPWDSYAMCIQGLIDKGYTKYLDTQIYVRNDLVSLDTGLVFDRNSIKMIPSAQLNASTPLKLYFPNSEKYPSAGLKRLGVMFGTHMRKNTGEAELRLNGPDGATYSKRFALPDLADNQYLYFDLDSRIYTSGEIVSISGGGVSTWGNSQRNDRSTYMHNL